TSTGASLDFNFDILGRLRSYDTSTRESTFNYEGSKRLGDFDNSADECKRYHWCKNQLLGYADDTNTYYIVPDVTNSTKLIMNSNSVVNRLDYDHLGYLRNKTTDPQVELLWKHGFRELGYGYLFNRILYEPRIGFIVPLVKYHKAENYGKYKSYSSLIKSFFSTNSGLGIVLPIFPHELGPQMIIWRCTNCHETPKPKITHWVFLEDLPDDFVGPPRTLGEAACNGDLGPDTMGCEGRPLGCDCTWY
ncbi:hypothetical protein JXI42_06875, partial [bacterium]|nr:hypothetical protein [bacterium]